MASCVLDAFITDKSYIHLKPEITYCLPDTDIVLFDEKNVPISFTVKKSLNFNIAYFLEFDCNLEQNVTIHIQSLGIHETVKLARFFVRKVFLQSVIVIKNLLQLLPQYIDFYKRYHSVDRFLIFDNNTTSDKMRSEFLQFAQNRNDVIYIPFNVQYKYYHSRSDITPDHFIVGQNSAYSIALKKYDAEWSLLFDVDEYLNVNQNISMVLSKLPKDMSAVTFNGYWTGCNEMNDKNFHYSKVKFRSINVCKPKLILKNKLNDYTQMIHFSQRVNSTLRSPCFFYHIRNLTLKDRKCQCNEYCVFIDPLCCESPSFSMI